MAAPLLSLLLKRSDHEKIILRKLRQTLWPDSSIARIHGVPARGPGTRRAK
jgi:hypothetical protein